MEYKDFFALVNKYNVQGPRYTSYPTVPYWEADAFSIDTWLKTLRSTFAQTNASEGISLYIHLPYCESLCTFCGCNKLITKNHAVEQPYIELLKQEWLLYREQFSSKPVLKEIHLGGGTPSFFSPQNLENLLNFIYDTSEIHQEPEFGFEVHPNNTTEEHLRVLYDLGFRRLSMGVQDYDPVVQKAIHRIQPFEAVQKITDLARRIGYTSINHDLVFGLPKQTPEAILHTIQRTLQLKPDRLAFYSYAHVPWIDGIIGQRGFSDEDIPKGQQKRRLYELGRELLETNGYIEIGLDHFALEHDSLYQAFLNQTLHRNFMGYTVGYTHLMIGLGISSIGDTWNAFAQNEKTFEAYQSKVKKREFPVFRGHVLTAEDLLIRKHILNIMCHHFTDWREPSSYFPEIEQVIERLQELQKDGLVVIQDGSLEVTGLGKAFVRNIAMAFDLRLQRSQPQTALFSMTV